MGDYVALETPSQAIAADSLTHGAINSLMQDTERTAGVSLVELWVLQEDSKLVRASYHTTNTADAASSQIHETVGSLGPAEGIPGILWTETANRRRYPRPAMKKSTANQKQVLAWRDIQSLLQDPHRIPTKRMTNMAQTFQSVAGVPFESWNDNKLTKGIILYYATDDRSSSSSASVGVYLASAALAIGHVYVATQQKEQLSADASLTSPVVGGDEETAAGSDEESQASQHGDTGGLKEDSVPQKTEPAPGCFPTSCHRVSTTLTKSVNGGGMTPPPPMPWQQSFFTLIGALITLAFVTKLSHYLVDNHGANYEIVLGPYGALVTLLFALSAAPAAQPRNAIGGQLISLTIAIAIGQYGTGLDVWMKQTLATGLSVAAMAKVGVTHPPAGAAAMLFSAGNHTWIHMAMMLVGNVIALASATLVNNWSEKRQYPTYWGFLSPFEALAKGWIAPSDTGGGAVTSKQQP